MFLRLFTLAGSLTKLITDFVTENSSELLACEIRTVGIESKTFLETSSDSISDRMDGHI